MAEAALTPTETLPRLCACGSPARQPGKRGPIPRDCETCCRARRSSRSPEQRAANAAAGRARYLATRNGRTRAVVNAELNAASIARRTHQCTGCGQTFVAKRTGTAGAYCSRGCAFKHCRPAPISAARRAVIDERRTYRAWAALAASRRRKIEAATAAKVEADAKASAIEARATRPCATCGGTVGGGATCPRSYCSWGCRRASEPYRKAARAAKARRKARERGAENSERFDPLEVLRRDGWRCHLCGIKTPERLRGTTDDRAPELDHIVPLSKGGEHSRRNTACACRRCNISKGDRILGQMLLMG